MWTVRVAVENVNNSIAFRNAAAISLLLFISAYVLIGGDVSMVFVQVLTLHDVNWPCLIENEECMAMELHL